MTYDSNALPWELYDTESAWQDYIKPRPFLMSHLVFASHLVGATTNHIEASDITIQRILMTHWVNYISLYLDNKVHVYPDKQVIDCFFGFLIQNKLASDFTKMYKGSTALAFMSMTYICQYEEHDIFEDNSLATEVLNQWLGTTFRSNVTLEKLVDALYGPAVWSLYATEVAIKEEIPLYLAQLNLPIVQTAKSSESTLTHVILPVNVI